MYRYEKHKNDRFPLSIHNCRVDSQASLFPHYHDNFELIFVKSGKLNIRIGDRKYAADDNSILFANMYQVHSASAINGMPAMFYAIVFDKKILETININDYYIDYIKPFIDGSQRFPEHIEKGSGLYYAVKSSIELIIEEYGKKELAYEIFIITAIERLFASFVRYGKTLHNSLHEKHSQMNKELLDSLLLYMKENYHKTIMLEDISSNLNINKYYLCRLIKKLTGKTFTQLLNMYRVRQAEFLLKSSAIPVYEVAEKSGFSNISYFNRIFLKYTGLTPSRLRM